MITIKEKLRLAFDAGRKQQQIDGNKWYPSKEERKQVFEDWYKNFEKKRLNNIEFGFRGRNIFAIIENKK